MGYVNCRSCNGSGIKSVWRDGNRFQSAGFKTFPCKACNGSGINQNLYSKSCEKCGAEIVYPRDASYPPKYCKSCKQTIQREKEQKAAKWKETRCKVCNAIIKYNTDWSKIPNTCNHVLKRKRLNGRQLHVKNVVQQLNTIPIGKIFRIYANRVLKRKKQSGNQLDVNGVIQSSK